VVKLVLYFVLYPTNICFLSIIFLFRYFYRGIKLYALLTLYVVSLAILSSLMLY